MSPSVGNHSQILRNYPGMESLVSPIRNLPSAGVKIGTGPLRDTPQTPPARWNGPRQFQHLRCHAEKTAPVNTSPEVVLLASLLPPFYQTKPHIEQPTPTPTTWASQKRRPSMGSLFSRAPAAVPPSGGREKYLSTLYFVVVQGPPRTHTMHAARAQPTAA